MQPTTNYKMIGACLSPSDQHCASILFCVCAVVPFMHTYWISADLF